jgi:hypothetical protein
MPPMMMPTLSAALIVGGLGLLGGVPKDPLFDRPTGIEKATATIAAPPTPPVVVPLDDTHGLTLVGTRARSLRYQAVKAVELTPSTTDPSALEEVALLDQPDFGDGTIELWVAGTLMSNAAADDRAFIGLVFHSTPDGSHFENFYIRPTNGRADDQLRRNHSTQYASLPDYPWDRLRKEAPGQYESYADLEAGQWTHLRVVVSGAKASLYVNDAAQPSLVVADLKMGKTSGKVGLWIGPGTRGYFSRLEITPAS